VNLLQIEAARLVQWRKISSVDSAKWYGAMGRSLVVAVASHGFDDRASHVKGTERLDGLLEELL
jgi:hypothetical protein